MIADRHISPRRCAIVSLCRFPGDGIGPEISNAVKDIFAAAKIPVKWEEQHVGTTADPRTNSMVSRENLDSVLRNGIGLKGPMATPIGKVWHALLAPQGCYCCRISSRPAAARERRAIAP